MPAPTIQVVFNPPVTGAKLSMTLSPTRSLTYLSTSETLDSFGGSFTSTGPKTLSLPATDQTGWVDAAGYAVTGWAYRAEGQWSFNGRIQAFTTHFFLPTGTPNSTSVDTLTLGNASSPFNPERVGLSGELVTTTVTTATGTITLAPGDLPTTRNWTLTGNVTLVLPTPTATKSGVITLVITQDATGSRTITWPATSVLKWPDGIAQQPATAANSVSVIHLMWTGYVWLGLVGGKSFA